MGCGSVDLIELYDLVRENLGGVRRRELEAHLQGCDLCAKDFHKLGSLVSIMKTIAADTDIVLSPKLLAHIETAMQKEASEFQSRKAWESQEKPASRPSAKATPSLASLIKAAIRVLLISTVTVVILAAIPVAAFRNGVAKELIWKGMEWLAPYPLIGRAFGIPDRAGITRIIEAFPATDATVAARLSDASRWLILAGAPPEETRFLELASRCAARSRAFPARQPPDPKLLDLVKHTWERAEAAPFEEALSILSANNEMLNLVLEGNLGPFEPTPMNSIKLKKTPEEDKGGRGP